MKVLITGAFGMVGRKLVEELETRGHELVLLDRVPPEQATMFVPGSQERQPAPFETKWPCRRDDVTDPAAMLRAAQGMDAFIHLAAGVTGLPEHGFATFHTNCCSGFATLDACRKAGVSRYLCASSINAFGTIYWRLSGKPSPYTRMPLAEDFEPVPEDAYSLSKHVNELTCAAFHRAFGITTAAFRFAGVWTDETYESVRKQGLAPTTAWSDDLFQWVHRSDVVRGIRQALEAPDLPGFGVYTLGAADTRCPEPTMQVLRKLRPDLAETVETPLVGRAPLMSIDRARATFGYDPKFRLMDD